MVLSFVRNSLQTRLSDQEIELDIYHLAYELTMDMCIGFIRLAQRRPWVASSHEKEINSEGFP